MATPRTGRPRGRPAGKKRSLVDDPDRYAVALGVALKALGLSERAAFDLAATTSPYCYAPPAIAACRGDKKLLLQSFELKPRPWAQSSRNFGVRAVGIAGRASTLRLKANGCDLPAEALFLERMANAIFLAMTGRVEDAPQLLELAASVGEEAFARQHLLLQLTVVRTRPI
jgi:hypothetical protein